VEVIGEVYLNAWHTPNHTHIVNAGQAVVHAGSCPWTPVGAPAPQLMPLLSGLLSTDSFGPPLIPHAGGTRRDADSRPPPPNPVGCDGMGALARPNDSSRPEVRRRSWAARTTSTVTCCPSRGDPRSMSM
jgi:hypothetical protein